MTMVPSLDQSSGRIPYELLCEGIDKIGRWKQGKRIQRAPHKLKTMMRSIRVMILFNRVALMMQLETKVKQLMPRLMDGG